jgi:hypothetical protein
MRARELERLLAKNGVGSAKLDAVTRKLRDRGYLPKSGRGPNAPHIGPKEAALVLVAVAGSTKGTEADVRLEKLCRINCGDSRAGSKTLPEAIAEYLAEPETLDDIKLVRVGRTSRHADVVHADGQVSEFRAGSYNPNRFRVEGVLPVSLLTRVAEALARSPSVPKKTGKSSV